MVIPCSSLAGIRFHLGGSQVDAGLLTDADTHCSLPAVPTPLMRETLAMKLFIENLRLDGPSTSVPREPSATFLWARARRAAAFFPSTGPNADGPFLHDENSDCLIPAEGCTVAFAGPKPDVPDHVTATELPTVGSSGYLDLSLDDDHQIVSRPGFLSVRIEGPIVWELLRILVGERGDLVRYNRLSNAWRRPPLRNVIWAHICKLKKQIAGLEIEIVNFPNVGYGLRLRAAAPESEEAGQF